ncbi:MAG: flavodoxin family protein [Erysipelotrichales bacterium]
MQVVVINGSPLEKGITTQITDIVLKGCDVKTYYAYKANIKPCIDCKYCFRNPNECIYKDEFQVMIEDISQADLVVLASPLHFSSFSGELLSSISRMQYLFALKYVHKQELPFKKKKALTIITAGNNYPTMFDAIKPVDSLIFSHINATNIQRLLIKETDKYTVDELTEIYKDEIKEIQNYINS